MAESSRETFSSQQFLAIFAANRSVEFTARLKTQRSTRLAGLHRHGKDRTRPGRDVAVGWHGGWSGGTFGLHDGLLTGRPAGGNDRLGPGLA